LPVGRYQRFRRWRRGERRHLARRRLAGRRYIELTARQSLRRHFHGDWLTDRETDAVRIREPRLPREIACRGNEARNRRHAHRALQHPGAQAPVERRRPIVQRGQQLRARRRIGKQIAQRFVARQFLKQRLISQGGFKQRSPLFPGERAGGVPSHEHPDVFAAHRLARSQSPPISSNRR